MSGGNYQRPEILLGALGRLCCAFGSGPSPTGHPVYSPSLPLHWICRSSPDKLPWSKKQVQAGSISSAITAIGQVIALATNTNTTKLVGSDKLLPCPQQMLDGFRKVDPPTTKQLPVEADISEYLVKLGMDQEARELDHAVGDLTMVAFYYLLRIGEYTTKGTRNNSKQTNEFKLGNIMFFAKDKHGNLRCLPHDAHLDLIISAEGATMKLDN
jgi:hypothetical protein